MKILFSLLKLETINKFILLLLTILVNILDIILPL